jgi:hypothetical protein
MNSPELATYRPCATCLGVLPCRSSSYYTCPVIAGELAPVKATNLLRQCSPLSPTATAPSQIHRPPLGDPINWACRRFCKVVKQPIHQLVPQIVHQSSPVWDFPQISPEHRANWPRRGQRATGPFMSLLSCFSTLMCPWCSSTWPIKLEPIRSPETLWIVPGLRDHREQRGWELEPCNWSRGNVC